MNEHIELYKVMIDTITANEQRRQQVTTVNTSLLAAGMAALGSIQGLDPIYIALPALALSTIWFTSIRYFRRLAKAKWAVVTEMEKDFEVKPFAREWEIFKSQPSLTPFTLTYIEMFVPILVLGLSTIYLVYRAVCYEF